VVGKEWVRGKARLNELRNSRRYITKIIVDYGEFNFTLGKIGCH
jgi:hypothetical protein